MINPSECSVSSGVGQFVILDGQSLLNKMSGIVSFRKSILGWLGDRTTAPSLLVRALYRCDHQAVQKVS